MGLPVLLRNLHEERCGCDCGVTVADDGEVQESFEIMNVVPPGRCQLYDCSFSIDALQRNFPSISFQFRRSDSSPDVRWELDYRDLTEMRGNILRCDSSAAV